MKSELRASTLVELLVTMIVAGITILAVTDGVRLFAKVYVERICRLRAYGESIEGFYRLDELITYADSIECGGYGEAEIWNNGRRTELFACDSSLICRSDGFCDTLLRGIEGMRITADSIFVNIGDTLAPVFPMPVSAIAEYNRKMDSIEHGFLYEEDRR